MKAKRVSKGAKKRKVKEILMILSLAIYPPDCPDNCEDFILPGTFFDPCNPEVNESQIKAIYITKPGFPLTNASDETEWNGRISDSSTDEDAIRKLVVVGGVALPEVVTKEISGQRTVNINKKRTLTFTVDELSDLNYDALTQLQCNRRVLIWFETVGGKLFGGNTGIEVDLDLDLELLEASGELQTVKGTGKWNSRFMPQGMTSPFTS